ncbi:hypothetical protein ACQP1V_36365 [Microtetraspora malaysiensis]|uniref:hypothetical protein n=1 Tax=Microtetraspora malaysiensis TaxID=161358 RepID=UPI003D8E4AC1
MSATGRTYLENGQAVTVVIWPNERRADLPAPLPYVRLRQRAPRNVLIRRPSGDLVVRPFRGLRACAQEVRTP